MFFMVEAKTKLDGIKTKVHAVESKVHDVITKDHPQYRRMHRTFGQRMADDITMLGGSWTFIIFVVLLLAVWVTLNFVAWFRHWDPYPFILLNLFLSCLAALQAPVILMSQNRAAERDYAVNRKAEREIEDIQRDLEEIKTLIRKR